MRLPDRPRPNARAGFGRRMGVCIAPGLALAAALLALPACAGPAGVGEAGPSARAGSPADRLEALTRLDQSVARVAQRLSDASVDLCPEVRLSAGWALHAAGQYGPALRPLAISRFGLDGDLPGLLAVPPGSAAAAAGLRQGDLIVAVDGHPLARGVDGEAAAYAGLAANIARLDAALALGPTSLTVRRDGVDRPVVVEPRRSCGSGVQLDPSDELNARADGRRLFISTALANFAAGDDELAVVLGHELAHHILHHRAWDAVGGTGRTANTDAGRAQGGPGGQEQQADRVGLYLAARAGYDPRAAAPFWRRFGAANWRVRYAQWGHASAEARARRLETVTAEIEARRAVGGALIP